MVPVSVARTWKSERSAFTWWLDDVQMDEGTRLKEEQQPPDSGIWNERMQLVKLFDQLIGNTDRNSGNLLIGTSWQVWAIDHTRAFRTQTRFPTRPTSTRCDRQVLAGLKGLTNVTSLKRELGEFVSDFQINGLLARRDLIVAPSRRRARPACSTGSASGRPPTPGLRRAPPGIPQDTSLIAFVTRLPTHVRDLAHGRRAAADGPAAARSPAPVQERDRSRIPDRYKWDLTDIYPDGRGVAQRQGGAGRGPAGDACVQGRARERARPGWRTRSSAPRTLSKDLSRAYVYASMKSDQDTRDSTYQGMQQEIVQVARRPRRRNGLHRTGDPEDRTGDDRAVRRRGAAAAGSTGSTWTTSSGGRRTPERTAKNACSPAPPSSPAAPATIYGILSDADFPYPTVTLSDGTQRPARQRRVQRPPRRRQSATIAQRVMSAFFSALGPVPGDVRRDAERADPERRVLREGAQVRRAPWHAALDAPNIPVVGLHAADRRRQPAPADLPPLPAAAPADAERAAAPLLRSLCAAGRLGGPHLQRGRSGSDHILESLAPLGPEYAAGAQARLFRAMDRSVPERRQARRGLLERRRLRRPPVHPA